MTAVLYHAVIVLRSGFGEGEKEIKGLNPNGRIGLKGDGKIRVGPIVVACALLGKDRIQYRQELLLRHREKVEVIAAFDLGDLAICAAQGQAEQHRKQIFFIASGVDDHWAQHGRVGYIRLKLIPANRHCHRPYFLSYMAKDRLLTTMESDPCIFSMHIPVLA